jgi:hypothetical protein
MRRIWLSNVSNPLTRVAAIVVVLCLLTWLGSLVVGYWGDEYASPSWDEQSVPRPKAY